MKITIS